jgi:hypothetical protein
LSEAGTDLRFIQALPGYSSIKTITLDMHLTRRRVHIIQNPPDRLMGEKRKRKTNEGGDENKEK